MALEVHDHVAAVLRNVSGCRLDRQNGLRQDGRVQVEELLPGSGLGRRLLVGLVVDRDLPVLRVDRREGAELEAGQVAPGVVPAGGANVLPVVLIAPVITYRLGLIGAAKHNENILLAFSKFFPLMLLRFILGTT